MTTYIRRFGLIFCLLALVAFAAGCGVDQSPVASQDEAVTLSEAPAGLLVFSTGEPERAAKVAEGPKRTGIKMVGQWGGIVYVYDNGEEGGQDDVQALFVVPWKALDEKVEISVSLQGDVLSNLVVEFGPSGLEFKKPAYLWVKVGADKMDADGVRVMHISKDGSEEISTYLKKGRDGNYYIVLKVPGFSRYSMGA